LRYGHWASCIWPTGRSTWRHATSTKALSLWDELTLPVFRARTLRDLAALHRRRGDLTTADATLREALEIFSLYRSREYEELTSRDSVHADPT
jgi:hypothetical protein